MFTRVHLLAVAAAYAAATDQPIGRISAMACGDSRTLPSLLMGRDITTTRADAAFAWFADHWPTDVAWPKPAHRPVHTPIETLIETLIEPPPPVAGA
jgi:hypothetical protein